MIDMNIICELIEKASKSGTAVKKFEWFTL